MSPESWAAPTEAMGYRSDSLQPKKHQRRDWVPELAEPIPMASAIDSRGRSPAPTQFFRGSVIESSVADSESQYGGFRTAPTRANAARSTQDARTTIPSGLIDDHAAVRESPARKGKGKTKGKSKGEKGGKGKEKMPIERPAIKAEMMKEEAEERAKRNCVLVPVVRQAGFIDKGAGDSYDRSSPHGDV